MHQFEYLKLLTNIQIDAKYKGFMTPLMIAVENKQFLIVNLLVEKGANIHEVDPSSGETILFKAAQNGYALIVDFLLQKSTSSINSADLCGRTPLSIAKQKGNTVIVSLLQRYGAR